MMISSAAEDDYFNESVPLSVRRGPLTMGLLWITMVTSFPSVLIGFQWYKDGFTLPQVLTGAGISCAILLAYTIPATQLGSRTGLGYATLSRSVFGKIGSRLIAMNLILIFIACYGLTALLLAQALTSLFGIAVSLGAVTAVVALLMAFNNFFGFKGVANFARFIAAPVMIGWVGYTFLKAMGSCPVAVMSQVPHVPFSVALTSISSFVVGFAVWGNEMDYWRFSRPRIMDSAMPLCCSLAIGQLIFPVTGWIVAHSSGVTEYGAATAFMTQYCFGGVAILPAVVLSAAYFACNDSNLFGSLQAAESIKKMSHQKWAAILGILGAVCGAWLSTCGASKSIEALCSLNCIVLPTPTVIMLTEWFLQTRVFGDPNGLSIFKSDSGRSDGADVLFKKSACIALLAGFFVGVLTSGLIPALEIFHVGVCSVQAWLTALIVYLPLRLMEYRREQKQLMSRLSVEAREEKILVGVNKE